ncbi:tetratricopeptide repeat protein [Tunicatimonas pelagia]|uniref:tetratricopeptide repeat protein n=1 Tax=Tunicatimonas pelagia TaxID=931531 RepID=UPI002665A3F7|nr:tetratricopeptide repeat protein [Tunicatimonas pelagia]WKN43099.1 tetratricopeptide repeat protein [Tunicatimonas pelagia]
MKLFFYFVLCISLLTACGDSQSQEGDKLFNQGKYEAAIQQYEAYLEYNPEDLTSVYNQGRAYEELGQTDQALENYERALKIDPNHANSMMSIGKYHFRKKNYADASFYFSKASEIMQSNPQVFFLKGRTHHKLGETDEAMEAYDLAISKDRDYGEAYLYRGALKVYQGKKGAGCSDIRSAQSLKVPEAETALAEYCN